MVDIKDIPKLPEALVLLQKLSLIAKRASDLAPSIITKELDKIFENPNVRKELDNGVIIYLTIESAISYASVEATREEISNVLEKLDIELDERVLDLVYPFGYRYEVAYLHTVNFLSAIKREINVENILSVVKAIDISADVRVAEYAIDFFNKFDESKGMMEYQSKQQSDPRIDALYTTIRDVALSIHLIVGNELKRSLSSDLLVKYLDRGLADYIIAAGFIAFAGRDIDRESISRVLIASERIPDEKLLDALHALHYKNHIVYLIVIYILKAAGKTVTTEKIIDIARSLYIEPDMSLAQVTLDLFNKVSDKR